jgi:uridine monophosphate synthetase
LAAAGYRTHAVLDIARITRVLVGAGRLTPEQAAALG